MTNIVSAETFPLGEFIRDEITARGLTERGFEVLLFATGSTPEQVLACEFAAYVDDKALVLDADTAACLGRAFDVSPEYFINLSRSARANGESADKEEAK